MGKIDDTSFVPRLCCGLHAPVSRVGSTQSRAAASCASGAQGVPGLGFIISGWGLRVCRRPHGGRSKAHA